MAFIRTIKQDNPFSQIDRFVFESDDSISWQAKGLMGYLLTRPDDWKINHKDLVNRATNGKDSVTSILKELEKAGYIHYYQTKKENGKFGSWVYDVYERPEFNPSYNNVLPHTEKPHTENTDTEKPNAEKSDYTNNKSFTNNDLTKNKLVSSSREITFDSIESDLKQKYPNAPFEQIRDNVLNDETLTIESLNQFKGILEYRLKNYKEPKQKTPIKRKVTRKEMVPDFMKEEYEKPQIEMDKEKFEAEKKALFDRIKKYKNKAQ
jgi:hypothetical protein